MTTYEDKVKEFHIAMKCDINSPISSELIELRYKLLKEELEELRVEIDNIQNELQTKNTITTTSKSKLLKELTDLQYVLAFFSYPK